MIPCSLLLASIPLIAPSVPKGAAYSDRKAVERVEAYLDDCSSFGWAGAALIAHEGKVVLAKGYGHADRGRKRRNSPDTLFEIASLTKPITACAIMKLQELGVLSIDDPIAKHLPAVPTDKSDITILHLLSHSSGMPRSAVGGGSGDLATAVRLYLGGERTRESGKAYEYWNGGYALLAGIVDTVTEQGYTKFCHEHIFGPAGMKDTGFTGETFPAKQLSIGYRKGEPLRNAAEHPYGSYGYQYRGMGGVVTSAMDLWRFAQAIEGADILKRESLDRMHEAVLESQGLGWGVTETKRGTRRIAHGGDVAGFHTQFQMYPDEGLVLVVLTNIDEVAAWPLAWNMEALFFGASPPYSTPPKAASLASRALDAFAGEYSMQGREGRVVVKREGSGLRIGFQGRAVVASAASAPRAPAARPFPTDSKVERGLESEADRAIAVVEAVVRKDAAWIRERLLEGIPKSWPDMLVGRIWAQHERALGSHVNSKVHAAKRLGSDAVQIILELEHARGSRKLQIVFRRDMLNIFALEPRKAASTASSNNFEDEVALAKKVLDAVRTKDPEYVRSLLMSHIPGSWPDRLVNEFWPKHIEENGELEDVSVIGANRVGEERIEILLGLDHSKQDRGLRIVFQGGRLNIFDLKAPRTMNERVYYPTSPTEFAAFEWSPPFATHRVRFEKKGRRVVSIQIADGGDEQLEFVRE